MESCFKTLIQDFEKDNDSWVDFVKKLQKHWFNLYNGKNTDAKFISHGDLWVNNIMVKNNSDEAKILDWQTLCPDHPIFDVIFLLCTSLTLENLEKWAEDLIKLYFESFQEACKGAFISL